GNGSRCRGVPDQHRRISLRRSAAHGHRHASGRDCRAPRLSRRAYAAQRARDAIEPDGGPGRSRTLNAGADVVIVGGGVIGCSIAYFAATAGARVTLIERTRLAAGASGVAAGMLAPQVEAPFADPFFELAMLGRAEHALLAQALAADIGLDVEYRKTGILRVARTEAERADLQRQLRWQTVRGL